MHVAFNRSSLEKYSLAGQSSIRKGVKVISVPAAEIATEHGAIQAAFAKKLRLIPQEPGNTGGGIPGGQGAGNRGDETADYIDFL